MSGQLLYPTIPNNSIRTLTIWLVSRKKCKNLRLFTPFTRLMSSWQVAGKHRWDFGIGACRLEADQIQNNFIFFFLKNNWFFTFKLFRCVMNYVSFMTIVTQFMFSTTLKVFLCYQNIMLRIDYLVLYVEMEYKQFSNTLILVHEIGWAVCWSGLHTSLAR